MNSSRIFEKKQMTLDVISWMPEGFFLISILGLLCFGITPGATPFQEQLAIPLNTGSFVSCQETENHHFKEIELPLAVFDPSKKGKNLSQKQSDEPLNFTQTHGTLAYSGVIMTKMGAHEHTNVSLDSLPAGGPAHSSVFLGTWAIPWCFLGFLLIYYCPLHTLMAGGVFLRDLFSVQLQSVLWLFAMTVMIITVSWQKTAGIVHPEYVTLTLLALVAQHLLICTTDLMGIYICLELQSFAIVVLCSLNYRNAYSIEAGMKYFLLSAFSSCLLLLGIGLIYWDTGLTDCHCVVEFLNTTHVTETTGVTTVEPSVTLWLGIWLVSLGLLWKLTAAPLHLWVADVYMGAWSSVTLFLSTLPKIAVLGFWVHTWHPLWSATFGNTMVFFSAFSLLVGALAPLAQTQLKRLLALSSVGHMGFMLIALCAGSEAFAALWVYLCLYLLTNLGIWGLVMWPLNRPGQALSGPQFIWDLSALNHSSPAAAIAWGGMILSLAGLPPVAGFLGKLGLFWCTLNSHLYFLVGVALISTLLSTVYYLRILKVAYVDTATSWGSYGTIPSVNAYLIAVSWSILVLLLWHGAPVILSSHLLCLSCSFIFFEMCLFEKRFVLER